MSSNISNLIKLLQDTKDAVGDAHVNFVFQQDGKRIQCDDIGELELFYNVKTKTLEITN